MSVEDVDVFRALAKIKSGDTLCSDLTIVDHKTWFSSVKRFFAGDTRYHTISIIEDAINSFCEKKEEASHLTTREVEMLERVRRGIHNISETYDEVSDISESLRNCDSMLKNLIISKPEFSDNDSELSEERKGHSSSSSSEFEDECPFEDIPDEYTNLVLTEEDKEDKDDEERGVSLQDFQRDSKEPVEDDKSLINKKKRSLSQEPPKLPPKPSQISSKESPGDDSEYKPNSFDEEARPASKFEDYLRRSGQISAEATRPLKKKNQYLHGGVEQSYQNCNRTGSQKLFSGRKSDFYSRNSRKKLHIITMGNVLSEIHSLPETLPNPLPPALSKAEKSRNIVWYEEKFVPR